MLKKDNPKDLDPNLTGLQPATVTGETSIFAECFPLFPLGILEGERAFECYQLPKHHLSVVTFLPLLPYLRGAVNCEEQRQWALCRKAGSLWGEAGGSLETRDSLCSSVIEEIISIC